MSALTATDPVYGDIVVALIFVLSVTTVAVVIDSVLRVLIRRWRAAGARVDQVLAEGLAEIDVARWEDELRGGGR